MHSLFVCFSRVCTEKVLYHSNFLLCFLRYSFVNIAIFNIIYKKNFVFQVASVWFKAGCFV